jgi:putative oxidoreductase
MNFEALGTAWAPRLLSVMRIMTGLLLLQHGLGKIFKFPVIPTFAKLDLGSMPGIAGFFELLGGVLPGPACLATAAFLSSGMCRGLIFWSTPSAFLSDPEQ